MCFSALAEHRKFFDAASALHISQSSFSRQIQMLENSVGVKLFTRNYSGCTLTDAGEAMLPYVERILGEYDNVQQLLADYKSSKNGNIIVYSDLFPNAPLTELLVSFKDRNPDIALEISELDGSESLTRLSASADSISLIYSDLSFRDDNFDSCIIGLEDLVLLINRRHRLAQCDCVPASELENETFQLMTRPHPLLHNHISKLCGDAGFVPKVMPHDLWYSTIPTVIEQLDAVSIMPRFVAERVVSSGTVIVNIENAPILALRAFKHSMNHSEQVERLFRWIRSHSIDPQQQMC